MILIVYVYVISFILNVIKLYKSYKGSIYYSLFFILRDLLFLILFNCLFNVLVKIFNIRFINVEKIVFIFIISLLLYFVNRKYICLSFSSAVFYIVCKVLNININFKDIAFLVGSLHIFEGVFLILSFNPKKVINLKQKMYLPLTLNSIPIIFLIFYRREKQETIYKKIISGVIISIYGIIILLISTIVSDLILAILIVLLHESIIFVEKYLFRKIKCI